MTYDVIIVGCGPVGALAANLLARENLKILVLEKSAVLHPLPRAVHIDHEMMRLFQTAGLAGSLSPLVRETDGHLHVGADKGVIRYMGTVGKPRPFGWANDYFFFQPELEACLRAGFERFANLTFVQGAEFKALEQKPGSASVSFQQGGKAHTAFAKWVIACDGARSTVRKDLCIALDDLEFEEPWLVVDVEVEDDVKFPELWGVPQNADLQKLSVMMCDPKRPATIVPGRGNHRRWEFMLLPGEADEEMVEPARVEALLEPYLAGTPYDLVRAATYRFHGLVAKQWQHGNVFLAGDAAHQTPPFFGQGMCHGFRDVANLAWKIAEVEKRGADPLIMATYQSEREAHVRSIIGAALKAGRYICVLDEEAAAQRDAQMRSRPEFGSSETAADLIPPIADGLLDKGSPAAGDRFIQPRLRNQQMLDDVTGNGWRLFALDLPSPISANGISSIEVGHSEQYVDIAAWLIERGANAVLVRPDHYVFGTCEADPQTLIDKRNARLGFAAV